jgi:hypothetical protein
MTYFIFKGFWNLGHGFYLQCSNAKLKMLMLWLSHFCVQLRSERGQGIMEVGTGGADSEYMEYK